MTKEVFQKFGELPYLLKVLDVKDMLSIQVHPSKEAAEKEYDAGKMQQAFRYECSTTVIIKTDNHKPGVDGGIE